jgi:hypothetical protein
MMMVPLLINRALEPGNFLVRPDLTLLWKQPVLEEIAWEVFRGRLLDSAHTRQTQRFTSWNVFVMERDEPAAEPILSVKLDETEGRIHVVRGILAHVWEGVAVSGGVIESRENTRWQRELVGTLALAEFAGMEKLEHELQGLLRSALEGTSRLPLHSVEAPLPAFSLGRLAYVPECRQDASATEPKDRWQSMLSSGPLPLEIILRSLQPDEARPAAREMLARRPGLAQELFPLLRELFTSVSLSPYTDFVDTTVACVDALVEQEPRLFEAEVDFWGWLLRQLGRHLTAYDLTTFHFRGANYPDALLLDAVLSHYVGRLAAHPELFHGEGAQPRRRRRALRQACLLRRFYEGHPVPDAPTSPGENARVLPPPHQRVPEEQLLNWSRRKRRLYADAPLAKRLSAAARQALHQSILDLSDPREWRELGSAVFIDRPLGWGKAVGEPDLTPLLAHEAYSPSIARRRFEEVQRLARECGHDNVDWDSFRPMESLQVAGLSATCAAEPDRPIVSLADARRVASDFVILQTLPRGLAQVFDGFDWTAVRGLTSILENRGKLLLVRVPTGQETVLAWYDGQYRKRMEMVPDLSKGFVTRGGIETPVAGLCISSYWDEQGQRSHVDLAIPRI